MWLPSICSDSSLFLEMIATHFWITVGAFLSMGTICVGLVVPDARKLSPQEDNVHTPVMALICVWF